MLPSRMYSGPRSTATPGAARPAARRTASEWSPGGRRSSSGRGQHVGAGADRGDAPAAPGQPAHLCQQSRVRRRVRVSGPAHDDQRVQPPGDRLQVAAGARAGSRPNCALRTGPTVPNSTVYGGAAPCRLARSSAPLGEAMSRICASS